VGTYINCKARNRRDINTINALWNKENPGYEDTFHLATQWDMEQWLNNIHNDPELVHLRYIKTTEELNKIFPQWGLGTFQVKITLGDYLCSEMARRYLKFFKKHHDLFARNSLNDKYVRKILEDTAEKEDKAEECLAKCIYCQSDKKNSKVRHIIKLKTDIILEE
jgi:hypothetical protein